MTASGGDIRLVFWLAVPAAFLAVAILGVVVHEPERVTAVTAKPPLHWNLVRQLGRPFWGVVIVGLVFTLARFSEAFLLLRGTTVGLELRWIPMLIVIMNVVYALTSYPAGRLSDRIGRYGLLSCGLLALIVADVLLALADGLVYLGAGVALWGLHMGLSQGLLASLVADTASASWPPA
jgi:sugar phosphate permease